MSLDSLPHLYVEGKSDEYAIVQLLMKHGIAAHAGHGNPPTHPDKIQIVVTFLAGRTDRQRKLLSGGRDLLLDGWEISLRSPKPAAVGLVLDADTQEHHGRGLQQTWQAVRDRLVQKTVAIPGLSELDPGGFLGFHSRTQTPLGVWIMPDNQTEGTTENFLLRLVRENDPLIEHAKSSAITARSTFQAPFSEQDLPQAQLHTWLAWQKNPPMSFGTAFNSHVLNHNADLAQRFVNWVRRLINAAP